MWHEFIIYLSHHDVVAASCVAAPFGSLTAFAAVLKILDDRQVRIEKRREDALEKKQKEAEQQDKEAVEVLAVQSMTSNANAANLNSAILEAATIPIITADSHLHIQMWNDAACVMFGWTRKEILGKSVSVIIPDDLKAAHFAGVDRYQQTGVSHVIGRTVHVRGLNKDGRTFPVILSLSEGINLDQSPFYCAFIAPDTGRDASD